MYGAVLARSHRIARNTTLNEISRRLGPPLAGGGPLFSRRIGNGERLLREVFLCPVGDANCGLFPGGWNAVLSAVFYFHAAVLLQFYRLDELQLPVGGGVDSQGRPVRVCQPRGARDACGRSDLTNKGLCVAIYDEAGQAISYVPLDSLH